MTLASGIEVAPERLADICRRYRVSELAVFGSAARGDMRSDSDVDVLVEFEPGMHPGLGFFDLEEELTALFGRRVDLGRKSLLKPLVRPSALVTPWCCMQRDAVYLADILSAAADLCEFRRAASFEEFCSSTALRYTMLHAACACRKGS